MDDAEPGLERLIIGLHITKCAGTSFITTLRQHLPEDHYHFCSSFHENLLAGRPLFAEILARDELRVVFGHFCHEYLLSVFRRRATMLITGLRDPLRRAISHFRQVNATRAAARAPLLRAYEFLMENWDSMCREILRCFPTIDQASDEPRWRKAAAALSMFDYIYSTEQFDRDVGYLFEACGIAGAQVQRDNVSDDKPIPDTAAREIDAQVRTIEAEFPEYFEQDIQLYQALAPYLSRPDLQKEQAFRDEVWRLDRAGYIERLPPVEEALAAYNELEGNHLAYEFVSIGRHRELLGHIDERIANLQRIRSAAIKLASEFGSATRPE